MNSDYQIIHGDCLEIMKGMADKSVDLVLTDPPYGIEWEGGMPNSDVYKPILNDKLGDIDYKVLINELIRIGRQVIIFGANNFYLDLPHKGSWICWDKRCNEEADKVLGSPFELAWMDKINQGSGGVKIYRLQHAGARNADGQGTKRFHPTQKPVELFKRIIDSYSNENDLILDPFAGSCTTLIAAKQLNRRCICIEKEEDYVKIGKERFASMTKDLFQ